MAEENTKNARKFVEETNVIQAGAGGLICRLETNDVVFPIDEKFQEELQHAKHVVAQMQAFAKGLDPEGVAKNQLSFDSTLEIIEKALLNNEPISEVQPVLKKVKCQSGE